MLRAQNNDMIKPSPFIGQSKKSGSKTAQSDVKSRGGQDLAGMNQAQQQKVLEQFRLGFYNILVCTCVAEEVSLYSELTCFRFSRLLTFTSPKHLGRLSLIGS